MPAVEIAQLENHVALLADKLHQLQDEGSAGALQAKLEAERSLFAAQIATLKAQLQAKQKVLAITQNQLGQAKDQIAASQAALKDLKTLNSQLSSQLSTSHKLITDLEDQKAALGTVGFEGDGAAVVNRKDPIFTFIQPSVFLPKSREKPKRSLGVPSSLFTSELISTWTLPKSI